MPRSIAVAVAALLLAGMAALAAPAASAAPVFPTGLRVGLETPPGLVVSHRFPGFEDPDHKVSVAIFELPGQAYDQIMQAGFDKQTQGMTNVTKSDFAIAGGSGYLVTGESKVNDQGEHRWFLMAKPKAGSRQGLGLDRLVRVDVPDSAREVYSDAVVRKMLASVDFRPIPTKELLGLLPFKLDNLAGFRVARVLPGGAILTDGPSDEIGSAKQPYVIVSVGRGGPGDPALRGNFRPRHAAQRPLERTHRDLVRHHPYRPLARLRAARQGAGPDRRGRHRGAMAALRHRRLHAHHRRRADDQLGQGVQPLPRRARRRRLALNFPRTWRGTSAIAFFAWRAANSAHSR